MSDIILTPTLTRELKKVVKPQMVDVNDTIQNTYQALQEIASIGEVMYQGLDRQRKVLKRSSRRLNRHDRVILRSVFEEVEEACHAIDVALNHFNNNVGKVLDKQQVYIVVKARQEKSKKNYNRYRRASSSLRLKSSSRRYKSASPSVKKAAVKLSIPRLLKNMLGGIGLDDNEKRLRKITQQYNSISGKITDAQSDVNNLIDEILALLNDLNPKSYPDKSKRILEVQKLKNQMDSSFDKQYEHILKFKNNFQHEVSSAQDRIQKIIDNAAGIIGEAGKPLPKEYLHELIQKVQEV